VSAAAVIPAPRDRGVIRLIYLNSLVYVLWVSLIAGAYFADRKYIAGFIVGDGMLCYDAVRGYEVKVTDKDKEFIWYLANLIHKIYGIFPRVYKDPIANAWRIRVFRKQVYLAIKHDIELAKREPDHHFTGGLYDAEGYWNPNKRKLSFTNKDPLIIELVSRFLTDQNIRYKLYQRRKGKYNWYVIETYTLQALKLLSLLDLRHPKWRRFYTDTFFK